MTGRHSAFRRSGLDVRGLDVLSIINLVRGLDVWGSFLTFFPVFGRLGFIFGRLGFF